MAQHAILRFEKHKGNPARPLEAHHERQKDQYASNPDIDTSRSKYNFHIVKPEGRYYHFIQSRIEQAGCRTRKDSTRFVDTLITASPEFFKGKSPKEIQAFFQRASDFLIGRVGRENIVSAVVHMDEKTPHLHLTFVPLTKDNRLCAKDIIGNRANLTKWQDDFHAYMVEKYPDLERGESASKTGRKHIPTRLFKQAVSLSRQARAIEATLDGINPLNAGKKKEEALSLLKKWFPQMENFSGQLKKYKVTINDLLAENEKLEARAKASEKGKIKDTMERAKLKSELDDLQRLVDRIPPDILPDLKHSKDEAWINALHDRIVPCMLNIFDKNSQKEIIRDYLEGKEAFANSAAFLKPIRNENRWIFNVDEGILEYRKLAGWDEFACRCMIVLCLTCTGNGISKPLLNNKDEKQTIDAFVKALPVLGLSVRDCMTVLATMCDQIYNEKGKKLLIKAVQKHFVTEPGLAGLADAALNSSASARIMAVEGLETLLSQSQCTEEARKALTTCAGDSSKQVQELLAERYIRHPDWEQDYLTMLGSKKAAVHSLVVRILAGIDTEKYRSTLEGALAVEKNAKVTDQITALLNDVDC